MHSGDLGHPSRPLLKREETSHGGGGGAALEMQRFRYLKGTHVREVSPGFSGAFKEEESSFRNTTPTPPRKKTEFRGSGPFLPGPCDANLA